MTPRPENPSPERAPHRAAEAPVRGPGTALMTDMYELTMLRAALADGSAHRRCGFEAFARRLPYGRRYGIVAGTGRLLDAITEFRFGDAELEPLRGFLDAATLDWLAEFRFRGDIDGYREGDLYFPGSPVLSVRGTFAECVVLETLVLSVLNHDTAIASAAARMSYAAGSRTLIEMGSRRTHEEAAVAAARAAYIAGFDATSNLEAVRRHGIPGAGTSAHSFTLLHTTADGPDEAAAFRSQVDSLGIGTTLLVDTYDITEGVRTAVEVAGTGLGAVRIDSGDLGEMARQVRAQLDGLGATRTEIVVSGDLDEYGIAALRAEPVDAYGVGTSLVTGSGSPTAGMVYKLVEVEGIPVAKRSTDKASRGGIKRALRTVRPTGTIVEELVYPAASVDSEAADSGPGRTDLAAPGLHTEELMHPLVRGGDTVPGVPGVDGARALAADRLTSVPWEGLRLTRGLPAVPTRFVS